MTEPTPLIFQDENARIVFRLRQSGAAIVSITCSDDANVETNYFMLASEQTSLLRDFLNRHLNPNPER